ncbi:hypothetical protein Gotri_015776 [Gossypium trilobum]|uniref:Uncharacterized protein n=1 Tax=Gossypium trilobum TaxID=34281 RepID=A0A7J9E1X6_9ROSI|nr:hypothetical protein [Gossypium trilobum]
MVMATIDLMPLTSDLADAINPIVYVSKTMTVSSLRALKSPPCMSLHANAILFISIDEANQAVRLGDAAFF